MKEKKENNAAVEEAYSKAMEEVYAEAKKKGKKSATSGDGTETDAVMPWYKKHMKTLMITAAVIIVIVAAVMTGLILYGNYYQSLTRGVLLYQDGGSMMSEKLFQDAVYSNQWDTWNFNEKGADNNENTAVVTTDGKYIYYAMNGNGTSFDLYYAKKGSSREVLISQGVTDYEVVGRGELYYAANGVFYRYNVKGAETQNLCSRATTFTLNGKKDTVLMLGEDGSLSSMELNNVGSLKILETDVTKIEAVAGDFRTIVYHKEDGLYMLTTKSGQKDKITKDFTECYVCNIDGTNPIRLGKLRAAKWLSNDMVVGMDDTDNGESVTASSIIVANLAGEKQTISNADVIAMYPTATTDGKHIGYVDGNGELFIINLK